MNDCPDVAVLQQFIDDELAPTDFESVDRHIESCGTCQLTLESITANDLSPSGNSQPEDEQVALPDALVRRLADQLALVRSRGEAGRAHAPSVASQTESSNLPDQLGDYRIIREIGRGGMGVVYEAEQITLGRPVALKVLPPGLFQDSQSRLRFQREATAAAGLHHTNIVPVYEAGEDQGTQYYAMQLIQGEGLDVIRDRLKRVRSQATIQTDHVRHDHTKTLIHVPPLADEEQTPTSAASDKSASSSDSTKQDQSSTHVSDHFRFVADIGRQAAGALHHAHERGILHRDVKPSNLILDSEGIVWLADFGLAKHMDDELTATANTPGTLRYMSPERFQGQVDVTSDVYSLGVSLYELLTLQPAFSAPDPMSMLDQIKLASPPSPRSIDRSIPLDLQTIVTKAMARELGRRYSTAAEMANDLTRFINGLPITARKIGTMERLRLWVWRNQAVASLTTILFGLTLMIAIVASVAAYKFNIMANEQTRLAEVATTATFKARRSQYYAESNLIARDMFSSAGIPRLRKYLKSWVPESSTQDVRGWEWHLLNSIATQETAIKSYATDPKFPPIINALDLTSDGEILAFSLGSSIVVVETDNWKNIATLDGHTSFVLALKFSNHDKFLATASEDRSLRIWDWRNSRLLTTTNYAEAIGAVAWRPDDSELVFQTNPFFTRSDESLHVVKVRSGEIIRSMPEGGGHLRGFGFTSDGRYLASTRTAPRYMESVVVWDTQKWEIIASKDLHAGYIYSVDWHGDDQTIVSAGVDRQVNTWNFVSGKTRTIFSAAETIERVSWSPDSKYLAIAGWDHSLRILDASTNRIRDVLLGHENRLHSLVWHPGGTRIYSSDWDAQIREWDLNRSRPVIEMALGRSTGLAVDYSVAWHPDGKYLSASNERISQIFDWEKFGIDQKPEVLDDCGSPAWNQSGQLLATADHDKTVLRTGDAQEIDSVIQHPVDLRFLGWHGGHLLYSELQKNHPGHVWIVDTANPKREFRKLSGPFNHIWQICISPDGQLGGIAHLQNNFKVLELQTGSVVRSLDVYGTSSCTCIEWSADGRFIALAGNNHVIEIWDTAKWERLQVVSGHSFDITQVAWNPEFERLASASRDKTVRIWDTTTWQTTLVLNHEDEVGDLAWSPDGKALASISIDGTVKVWNASQSYVVEE